MKLKSIILPVLAIGCLAISAIGSANAYFTTYVTAKGGYVVSWEHREKIHEKVQDTKKLVQIENLKEESSIPVYVRVKAFSQYNITGPESSQHWFEKDGYYYYDKALQVGELTSEILFQIKEEHLPIDAKPLDNFNIIVVYETIPAFDGDNVPTDADSGSGSLSSK